MVVGVRGGDSQVAIRRRVEGFAGSRCSAGEVTTARGRAAVAVCVLGAGPAARVLLVRRAARGFNAGQWAFPGGRAAGGETAYETALREANEEVGLVAAEGAVAGLLDDFVTDSGFVITPVVVLADADVSLSPAEAEVHSVHTVTLARLRGQDLPHWAPQPDGPPLLQMPLGDGMRIHAPTGAILYQFREVALLGRPTRVAGLRQPPFTRS
jgi:8-oxo-dGTP pyrophosphatase MutT (NUDIX family)